MTRRTGYVAQAMLAFIGLVAVSAHAGDVTIKVEGVQSADGRVMVALFDKAGEFPRGVRRFGAIAGASNGPVSVVIKDVPPGRYAASLFHDVNGNERLDANLLGIPSEPYGFSRNARGRMGPPGFDEAAFDVSNEPVHLSVRVK